MVVGILRLKLRIRNSRSLKDKRRVLRKIKDKVHHHFKVSIAEVEDQDLWQSAVLGISVVGSDSAFVESLLSKILNMVEGLFVAEILDQQKELVRFKGDL